MKKKILIIFLGIFFWLTPFLVLAINVEDDEIYQNYNQTKNRATNIANQVTEFLSDQHLSFEERVSIITNPDFGQPEEVDQTEDNDNQESNSTSSEKSQFGQVMATEKTPTKTKSRQPLVITDRRSEVASFVQEILNNTEDRADIGQQVREIAQNHAQNHENLIVPLSRLQNQNRFIRFIFGPEPQALEQAQQILQDNQAYLEELKNLKNSLDSDNERLAVDNALNQIKEIENELKIVVESSNQSFSVFGWLIRLVSARQR